MKYNSTEIAVLLTCHNRKSKTISCLKSLYSNILPPTFFIDVFLVDDNSEDGTSYAVSQEFPEVNIIKGSGDLYWNRGMHLAWTSAARHKNYDYYLWLNDDTILSPFAISHLLDCASRFKNPLLICGAVSSQLSNEFTYGGLLKSGKPIIPNGEIQNCEVINGNCVLVNKGAYELAGNLDPHFSHAIGDHDYGLRLLKLGGEVKTTSIYVGHCEKNEKLPNWCYSETPILTRLKSLYSPLGNSHPLYFFVYERRHFGLFTAIKHYLSIHLRVLIPSLWK